MNLLKRSRTFATLIVTAGLLPLLEGFANRKKDLAQSLFYFEKTYGKYQYDIGFFGDSRTGFLQLKPFKMHIKNATLCNLARGGGSINRLLLEAASMKVKENGKRIFVFGLTPLDITQNPRESCFIIGTFCLYFRALRSFYTEARKDPFPVRVKNKEIDLNACFSSFRGYKARFRAHPFLHSDFQHFVQNLKWCKRNNIKVVAYRMVSCREMDELEDKLSGVDWNKIKQAVLDEGFVWLERPPSPLLEQIEEHCWDASHLNTEGAELFSNWLGQELAKLDWLKENQQTSETKK